LKRSVDAECMTSRTAAAFDCRPSVYLYPASGLEPHQWAAAPAPIS